MVDIAPGNIPLQPGSVYYYDGANWIPWTGNPASLQAQAYYWDGAAWQKWTGNPTNIQARVYYWTGLAWVQWTGNPASIQGQAYYWDGATWQKWTGNPASIQGQAYYWDGAAWQKWTGNPASIQAQMYGWDGANWQKLLLDSAYRIALQGIGLPQSLAAGQLAATFTNVYTVPANKWAKGLKVHVFNTSTTTAHLVYAAITRSGSAGRFIYGKSIAALVGDTLQVGELSASDALAVWNDTASVVDYTVVGEIGGV